MAGTPEEAFANLMKAQGAHLNARNSAGQQILREALGEHNISFSPQAAGMSREVLRDLAKQLAFWQQRFPNTVEGLELIEDTFGPTDMAHFRPMHGSVARPQTVVGGQTPTWALGVEPGTTLDHVAAIHNRNQQAGFFTRTPSEYNRGRAGTLWTHEFGHALDNSLDSALNPGGTAQIGGVAGERAAVRLNSLKSQLIEDALAGRISGYAKNSARDLVPSIVENWRSGDRPPNYLYGADVPEVAAADLRSYLHPRTINSIAKEPFAEAFAKNPAMLNEVESLARSAGWRGNAQLGTLLKGAGMGTAMLAGPIIGDIVGQKLGGEAGKAVRWASQGAGIGGMFGAPGALAGAGIGALASQLLG